MGLTLGVGWLSEQAIELDADEFEDARQPYDDLNAVLREAGMAEHIEPTDLAQDKIWSSDMWGYGGLHAIRRLAAYHELTGTLPAPQPYEDYSTDKTLGLLYDKFDQWYRDRNKKGLVSLFKRKPDKPRFQHLLWHSDAEGFYVPRDFRDVILDRAQPQRAGLGGMVGSTQRLLDECRALAEFIAMPAGLDEEGDRLLDVAEAPSDQYRDWRGYGVEAFGLVRLIKGCEKSIELGAALVFG